MDSQEKDTNTITDKVNYFTKPISFGHMYDDQLEDVRHDNKSLWYMIMLLIFIIAILLANNHSISKKATLTVDLPPRLYALEGQIDVTADDANDLYYQAHAQYLLREISEFKAGNHEDKLKKMELMMTPARHAYKETDFLKEKKFILQNNISQEITFAGSPSQVTTLNNDLKSVKLNLMVTQSVGEAKLSPKECFYEIAMFRQDWKLYVFDYRTNCFENFGGTSNGLNK